MRALIIAAGLLVSLAPTAPAVAKPEPVVRFATYNVCKTSCGTGRFDWTNRSRAVIRNILSAKPDVLALQEVDNSYQWIENRLRGHGYARVAPQETSCRNCVDDSHLYYRTSVIAMVSKEIPREPIPAECVQYFPVTPGVLVAEPAEPVLPPRPEYPDYDDPDYDKKVAEYEAWWALYDQKYAEYARQYTAYRTLVNAFYQGPCEQYLGWSPTTRRGSAEVALSTWGDSALAGSVDDRSLMRAVLKVKATGDPFMAVSMHLPNEKGSKAERYRKSLARAIPARLRQAQQRLGIDVPTVLMGDLNSYWQRQPRGAQWILGRGGFKDAFTAPKKVNGDVPTVNVTSQLRNPFPAKPFHFDKPARLDYVMAKGGTAVRYEVHLRLRGGRFDNRYRGSDHNLVMADVRLDDGRLPSAWHG